MNDEQKLKDAIAKGKEADQWLNHPIYKNVLALRQAALLKAFKGTKWKEREERDEIWRKFQALDSITSDLERVIRDAERAEKTLLQRIRDKIKK